MSEDLARPSEITEAQQARFAQLINQRGELVADIAEASENLDRWLAWYEWELQWLKALGCEVPA